MIRYKTKSGSTYEVVGMLVRRAVRSSASKAERVAEAFRIADSIECKGIGHPLVIVWGTGRDVHSANADQIGTAGQPDEAITRMTQTTPVIEIEHEG